MKLKLVLIASAACLLGLSMSAQSRILTVPGDYGTIGEAATAARANDTVLVENGNYAGDGNLSVRLGANVTLMSVDGPAQCIIDAEGEADTTGYVMSSNSKIIGFTFTQFTHNTINASSCQNILVLDCKFINNVNRGNNQAVGIKILGTTGAVVQHCIFQDNYAGTAGAAIWIRDSSVGARVWDCIFMQNETTRFGGGVAVTGSNNAVIGNCLFIGNFAGVDGGGLAFTTSSTGGTVRNCTFVNNSSRNQNGWGGGIYKGDGSSCTVINSIFWGNSAANGNQLGAQGNQVITISYCLVEGGNDPNVGRWSGQNIIDDAPLFVEGREPLWGLNFYYLDQAESPAVDAGSANSAAVGMDTLFTDPEFMLDTGMVDLGFHYDPDSYLRLGIFTGYVLSAQTGEGIFGVQVVTSRRMQTSTTPSGFWRIPDHRIGTYDISFTHEAFLDTVVRVIELEEYEEEDIRVTLLHTTYLPSIERINAVVDSGQVFQTDFDINNTGSGVFTYRAQPRLVGEMDREPWTFRRSYNVGATLNDDRINGALLIDSLFYIAGANTDPDTDMVNVVYRVNKQGELIDTFPQFGESRYGMKGMTYDGNLIWGSGEQMVYGFDPSGNLTTAWDGPLNPVEYLAYDIDRDVIWLTGITTDIISVTRDGVPIDTIRARNFRKYGLVYWPQDPDGHPLYLIHRSSTGNLHYIYKINPDDRDTIMVSMISGEGDAQFNSASIEKFDIFSIVFTSMANVTRENGGDRIDVWQLAGNTNWMILDPMSGEIPPESNQQFTFRIDMAGFPVGQYDGQIVFYHNAVFGEDFLPVHVNLRRPSAVGDELVALPVTTAIDAVKPNPFNGMTTIHYQLASEGIARLAVYDLAGREVAVPIDGYMKAGAHTLNIDARVWPSGVYIAKLESAGAVRTSKLVLLR